MPPAASRCECAARQMLWHIHAKDKSCLLGCVTRLTFPGGSRCLTSVTPPLTSKTPVVAALLNPLARFIITARRSASCCGSGELLRTIIAMERTEGWGATSVLRAMSLTVTTPNEVTPSCEAELTNFPTFGGGRQPRNIARTARAAALVANYRRVTDAQVSGNHRPSNQGTRSRITGPASLLPASLAIAGNLLKRLFVFSAAGQDGSGRGQGRRQSQDFQGKSVHRGLQSIGYWRGACLRLEMPERCHEAASGSRPTPRHALKELGWSVLRLECFQSCGPGALWIMRPKESLGCLDSFPIVFPSVAAVFVTSVGFGGDEKSFRNASILRRCSRPFDSPLSKIALAVAYCD